MENTTETALKNAKEDLNRLVDIFNSPFMRTEGGNSGFYEYYREKEANYHKLKIANLMTPEELIRFKDLIEIKDNETCNSEVHAEETSPVPINQAKTPEFPVAAITFADLLAIIKLSGLLGFDTHFLARNIFRDKLKEVQSIILNTQNICPGLGSS